MTYRLAHGCLALVLLGQAACATLSTPDPVLGVIAQPSEGGASDALMTIAIRNLAGHERCLRAEILQRPRSAAQVIRMRYGGDAVPLMPEGFLVPQSGEVHHLPREGSASFQVDIRGHFQLDRVPQGDVVEVSVGVRSWNCSAAAGDVHTDWSPWVRIPMTFRDGYPSEG